MRWSAYLFATLATSDFLKLTPETVSDLGHRMYILPLSAERAGHRARSLDFIFRDGDRIVVGRQGKVGDVLGMDHPFAWEISAIGARGRESQYTLAFVADANAPVPSRARIDEALSADLEILLERAHKGERDIEHSRTFGTERGSKASRVWRKAFEGVARQGGVRLFLSGDPIPASEDFGAGSSHITGSERAALSRADRPLLRPERRALDRTADRSPAPPLPPPPPGPPHDRVFGMVRMPRFRPPGFLSWQKKSDLSETVRTLFIQGVSADEAAARLGAPEGDVHALYRRLERRLETR